MQLRLACPLSGSAKKGGVPGEAQACGSPSSRFHGQSRSSGDLPAAMRPHGQGLVQRWGRVCFLPPAPYNSAGEFEQATAPPVRLGYAEVLMQEGKLRCPAKGTMAIGKGFQNCALSVGLYTYPELTPQNLPRGCTRFVTQSSCFACYFRGLEVRQPCLQT